MNKYERSPADIAEHFIHFSTKNVFLTGKAGTGKTTLLKKIIATTHKKTLVTAPTGIAALNAGGVTLHSQFQLPFGGFLPTHGNLIADDNIKFETKATLGRHTKINNRKRQTIREAELLIIDEVSMLRADLLDAIDFVLQKIRKNTRAFGGLQVLFIGDLLQLPPVVKKEEWNVLQEYYYSPFFFAAQVLQQHPPVYVELEKIYRQEDKNFTDILNHIRYNQIRKSDVEILNQYYIPHFKPKPHEGFITLTTHNKIANDINQKELARLSGVPFTFHADIEHNFPENIYPSEVELILKEGAQVMFIKNDYSGEGKYYNGKIGIITQLEKDRIIVKTDTHNEIEVERYRWENIRYTVDENTREIKEEVLGTFTQFPLRLAWAITIHKSQGLTFDKAIIDVRNVFAAGQSYVALSRLRSLNGLVLSTPFSLHGINNDRNVLDYEETKEAQGDLNESLARASNEYLQALIKESYNFSVLLKEWKEHLSSYNKLENLSEKQRQLEWAQEQFSSIAQIAETGDKFLKQVHNIFVREILDRDFLFERLSSAKKYFTEPLRKVCANVFLQKRKMTLSTGAKEYAEELELLDALLMAQLRVIHKCKFIVAAILNDQVLERKEWEQSFDVSWRVALAQIPLEAPQKPKKKKKEKGETYKITLALYGEGKNIAEIARERKLSTSTIETHFARLIEEEKISIFKIMTHERWSEIKKAIESNATLKLREIHAKFDNQFSLGEIKIVQSSLKHEIKYD